VTATVRARRYPKIGAAVPILALTGVVYAMASSALAQQPAVPTTTAQSTTQDDSFDTQFGPLSSTLDLRALEDLPSTMNLFSLLETGQPEVVSDRFSGSVNLAEPARLGVFLTSWTQTTFLLDGVDVTSAARGGPLFVPSIQPWQRVGVISGAFPINVSGPGLLITLDPQRPPERWQARGTGAGSGSSLVGTRGSLASPIARPAGTGYVTATVGGPIAGGRAGLLVSASTMRASQFDKGSASTSEQASDTVLAHLVVSPSSVDEVRTIGIRQITRYPGAHGVPAVSDGSDRREETTHIQSTWQHASKTGFGRRAFVAFTDRAWDLRAGTTGLRTIERLADGPPSPLGTPGAGREQRWSAGWSAQGSVSGLIGGRHQFRFGADISGVSSREDAAPAAIVGERVGGLPARLWRFSASRDTRRTRVGMSAFVSDSVQLWNAVTLQGGLRIDRVTGKARGAPQGITWTSVLPRLSARWDFGWAAVYAAETRTADSLLTDVLSYGDPEASVSEVYRWDGGRQGSLVARGGPGAGADGALTLVDPGIERPITREIIFGFEMTPPRFVRTRMTAISRRRSHQVALRNVGVPVASYDVFHVADPGPSRSDPIDDQLLPIYNRSPATFGMDRYELSNSDQPATFHGVTVIFDRSTPRVYLSAAVAMGWTDAAAGNRGYGPGENDAGLVGELLTDPNATTHARGNVFADRQYDFRVATAYKLPHDISFGVVARYQDGQPFSRMVILPDLNQGADAVRAFRSGKSRFTFTGTLDIRVQKGIALPGGGRAALVLDGFNVINMDKEVEEWVVTGAEWTRNLKSSPSPDPTTGRRRTLYRTPTLAQPPRALHIGMRVSF